MLVPRRSPPALIVCVLVTISTNSILSLAELALRLLSPSLDHPQLSSLNITNLLFRYASPGLSLSGMNFLLHSISLILIILLHALLIPPIMIHISHHQHSHHPLLLPFHFKLKTHLYHRCFPPLIPNPPDCLHGLWAAQQFLCFTFFSLFDTCDRLNWLTVIV